MPKKKLDTIISIGKKIKKIRLEKKISLDQLANETGLNTKYIKDVESSNEIPPVGTILRIAKAMQVDSGFLFMENNTKIKDRVKAYTKRTNNYAYDTLTPGAENKNLKAFKVKIDPMKDHKGVGYSHEGEEFVYVLKGKVEIKVGEHINILNANDSLHFNSGINHLLKNIGKEIAELIVVIYGK